jgi:hypothetical protein
MQIRNFVILFGAFTFQHLVALFFPGPAAVKNYSIVGTREANAGKFKLAFV